MEKVIAWHFTGPKLRDGAPIPSVGHTLRMEGPIILCERGYHASLHPFDALQYAPGPFLHKVELGGVVLHGKDKLVASERTILQSNDVTDLLYKAARQSVLNVIHLWSAPKIVEDYLRTGDKTLRSAARSAAWSAAWSAAESAAWSAVWSAAESAAWYAPQSAARSAARYAVRYAARYAAQSAARSAQREQFLSLVNDAFKE